MLPIVRHGILGDSIHVRTKLQQGVEVFDPKDSKASIDKANQNLARAAELASDATAVEQGLIRALAARFPRAYEPDIDFGHLDPMYAEAMRPGPGRFTHAAHVNAHRCCGR